MCESDVQNACTIRIQNLLGRILIFKGLKFLFLIPIFQGFVKLEQRPYKFAYKEGSPLKMNVVFKKTCAELRDSFGAFSIQR